MKKLLSILSLAILISSCWETKERISFDKVTIVDDVCYLKADMSIVTGIVTEAYSDGQLMSERTYKDGKPDGLAKSWSENGQLKYKSTIKNGKLEGPFEVYYENGQLESKRIWKDGTFNGPSEYYHENGKKSQVARYLKGEKHGVWKVYDENGNITVEQEWSEGVSVIDTNRLKNDYQDIKIDGYDVQPILVDPNSD